MKKVLLGLLALGLIGGGGAGVYVYFMKPAEAAVTEDGQHKKAKKEKSHKNNEHFEFVELDPLVLPIIDEDGVNQVVSMVIAIEVADANSATTVKNLSPRLKDAFIQDMYGVLNKHAALKGGVIQVNMIKSRLNKISHKVLGEDVVQDVLLQVVQQRPI